MQLYFLLSPAAASSIVAIPCTDLSSGIAAMPRSASRPSNRKKTSRSTSASRIRTKGSIRKIKRAAVKIGSKALEQALDSTISAGSRSQSVNKLRQRRRSMLANQADAADMAAACMDLEGGNSSSAEVTMKPEPPPKTDPTDLSPGEKAFVEVMARKWGDGTAGGFKKMAKDTDINTTNASAGAIKRLFQKYRLQFGQPQNLGSQLTHRKPGDAHGVSTKNPRHKCTKPVRGGWALTV